MRVPTGLLSLLDHGLISEVVRPLMSGKEAQIYLVISEGEERVAKVYKHATKRSFKHRAVYTEGRKIRNSRDRRAMAKGSKYGKKKDEAGWRSAEVDMIYRLRDADVRVPIPHYYLDGVLVMELVKDEHGDPAPRLGELSMEPYAAKIIFEHLIQEVVKMLCAGVVHGDLSDFNVLMDNDGPVIIDFPQALNAAGNQSARKILIRDVANLNTFLQGHASTDRPLQYAEEMWDLYARGELRPDTILTGRYHPKNAQVDVASLLEEIQEVEYDEQRRRANRD